jgi:chromosome segregation ATPase
LELQGKINKKSNEIYALETDAKVTQISINSLNEIIGANNTLINSINDDISAINKGIEDQAKTAADAKAKADKSHQMYEDFKNNAPGFFFQ